MLTYTGSWDPGLSHCKDIKNPAKHQADKAVKTAKSPIIALRDRNTMLSESRLNASRGMTTGAAIAITSRACSPGPGSPIAQPYNRKVR